MVEGDGQLWGSGHGAIAGCHCSVLWLGGDDQGGVDAAPLLGAIAIVVRYGGGGEGDGQLWCAMVGGVTTKGEWTRRHCWVPLPL